MSQPLQLYTRATSALLAGQAALFLLTPSMGLWLLTSTPQPSTSIETLLARLLSLPALLSSFLLLLSSGELGALYSADQEGGPAFAGIESPFAAPTLAATLVYHVLAGTVLYVSSANDVALSSGVLGLATGTHWVLAAGGLLIILFGKGKGHISKRTGADKRTSGFPFRNAEADKRKMR